MLVSVQKNTESAIGSTESRSATDSTALINLLRTANDGSITILYRPAASLREEAMDFRALTLRLPEVPSRIQLVRGQVDLISFTLPGGKEPIGTHSEWQDSFGNKITQEIVSGENNKAERLIHIIPAFALEEGGQNASLKPLHFDLSRLGLGTIHNVIAVQTLPIAGTIGGKSGYNIYLDTNSVTARDITSGKLSAFASGGATAERTFGLKGTSTLKKIIIYQDVEGESFFDPSNHDAIFLAESSLDSDSKQLAAFRQTTSLIDNRFNISGGSFNLFVQNSLNSPLGERLCKLLLDDEFPDTPEWKEFYSALNNQDKRNFSRDLFTSFITELQKGINLKLLPVQDRKALIGLASALLTRIEEMKTNGDFKSASVNPTILEHKLREFLLTSPDL